MKFSFNKQTILAVLASTSVINTTAMSEDKYNQSVELIDKIMYGKDLSGTKIVINAKKAFPDVPTHPHSDKVESTGLGDMFQFFGPQERHLKNYGADDVVVSVPKFLHNFYKECSPLKLADGSESKNGYHHIELATMYELLGSGPKTYKPENPYLMPSVNRLEKWLQIMAETSNGDLPVLFFHDGNRKHSADRFLEKEDVDSLVKNIEGVQFYNAQFYEKDQKPFEYDHVLQPCLLDENFNKDGAFLDDAAVIAATLLLGGVIITQDTGTHWLSTGIGEGLKGHNDQYITKKIWTFIKVQPDQRHLIKWGNTEHKSVWSPRITRLYRQKKEKEGWTEKIEEMRSDLKLLADDNKNSVLNTL